MDIPSTYTELYTGLSDDLGVADSAWVDIMTRNIATDDLKRLYMYSERQILEAIMPDLPFIDNPRDEAAAKVIRPEIDANDLQPPKRIFYARDICAEVCAGATRTAIEKKASTKDKYLDSVLRVVSVFRHDTGRQPSPIQFEAIGRDDKSLDDLTHATVLDGLFGGSALMLDQGLEFLGIDVESPAAVITEGESIFEFINSTQYRNFLAKAAGLSMHDFLHGVTMRSHFEGDESSPMKEAIFALLAEDAEELKGDAEVTAGCPARTLPKLMSWGSNLTMAAFIMIAEQELFEEVKSASEANKI